MALALATDIYIGGATDRKGEKKTEGDAERLWVVGPNDAVKSESLPVTKFRAAKPKLR